MDTNTQIQVLIDKHISTLKDNGQQVIEAFQKKPPDLMKAQAVAHMIKGAAGSIGFVKYSEVAKDLEMHLKAVIAGDGQTSDESVRLLNAFQAVHAVLKPTDSNMYRI